MATSSKASLQPNDAAAADAPDPGGPPASSDDASMLPPQKLPGYAAIPGGDVSAGPSGGDAASIPPDKIADRDGSPQGFSVPGFLDPGDDPLSLLKESLQHLAPAAETASHMLLRIDDPTPAGFQAAAEVAKLVNALATFGNDVPGFDSSSFAPKQEDANPQGAIAGVWHS